MAEQVMAVSGDMPKVWWSPSEDGFIMSAIYGGCYDVVRVGNVKVDVEEELSTIPDDAVELVPVSDTPATSVEAAKRVKAFLDNRGSLGGDEIATSYAAGAFKHGLRASDLRALIEWQEVTDDE